MYLCFLFWYSNVRCKWWVFKMSYLVTPVSKCCFSRKMTILGQRRNLGNMQVNQFGNKVIHNEETIHVRASVEKSADDNDEKSRSTCMEKGRVTTAREPWVTQTKKPRMKISVYLLPPNIYMYVKMQWRQIFIFTGIYARLIFYALQIGSAAWKWLMAPWKL